MRVWAYSFDYPSSMRVDADLASESTLGMQKILRRQDSA